MNLNCTKCGGSGIYSSYGQCFECRGSGQMVLATSQVITFQDRTYKQGDLLPFTASSGLRETGSIVHFYHSATGTVQSELADGLHDISRIWVMIRNVKTGKDSPRPLYGSIDIRMPGTLF